MGTLYSFCRQFEEEVKVMKIASSDYNGVPLLGIINEPSNFGIVTTYMACGSLDELIYKYQVDQIVLTFFLAIQL